MNRIPGKLPHLGGLTAGEFLNEYWQKKPLLIRQAFPALKEPFSAEEVLALSGREDAESRLIVQNGTRWALEHGPFTPRALRKLHGQKWTVLVQDTQHFSATAWRILQVFNFIPSARVDDLMVSHAVPGGGVGPHVDSYDVFLLQGTGKRRWQISAQRDQTLVPDAPLKLLARFKPQQEWTLETGDMLYLPPGYAHNGIAETTCLTWSIGFRAPTYQELATAFLDFLRDELTLQGQYGDPHLVATLRPGKIDAAMQHQFSRLLKQVRATTSQIDRFIGRYLTEPKPHVYFDPPSAPLNFRHFVSYAESKGLSLDLKTRLLYLKNSFFINGMEWPVAPADRALFRLLADKRTIPATRLDPSAARSLYENYLNGYLLTENQYGNNSRK